MTPPESDGLMRIGRSVVRRIDGRVRWMIKDSDVLNWLRGRPLRRLDPSHLSYYDATGRQAIDTSLFAADPSLAVILIAGQSNIANEGDPDGLIVPAPGAYNFNLFDGRCFVARDPLLGATCDRSNVATRLADLLINSGTFTRVLLVPIAHGGTFIREWTRNGRMGPRLLVAMERLREAGIGVTHVLWQSGEAEGAQANADARAWTQDFGEIVDVIRVGGVLAPIYVAQCTVCCSGPNEVIRSAQREVRSQARGVFAGPDLDTIGPEKRWDGCHFSAAGLQEAAQLWFDCLRGQSGNAPFRALAQSIQPGQETVGAGNQPMKMDAPSGA
jgi:hypothetical protein